MGRFINADAYTATGQGLLGNNMFAYCGNNPARNTDPHGKYAADALRKDPCAIAIDGGVAGAGATIVGGLIIGGIVVGTVKAIQVTAAGVYAFAKALLDAGASMYANHQPRVHHVIPRGKFHRYGAEVVGMMNEMHDMLTSVGIDINDPQNLLIVSHGSHKSMHTKEYIYGIYDIMMQAKGGDEGDVRQALFYARLYAASWDIHSNGW